MIAHRKSWPLKALTCVLLLNFASLGFAQQRRIELEVLADSRAAPGTQQQWMQMLQEVGADRVVVKTGRAGTPSVEETELSSSTLILVTGWLQGNKLALPGGTFSIRDKAKIRALLTNLRDDGTKVALAEKKAFGMTSEQLVQLHSQLSKPLDFKTRGESSAATVQKIEQLIGIRLQPDATARAALRGDATVAEELEGISAGTALAVVLRPLGLVLEPRRRQGQPVEVMLVDSQMSDEHWPIGWPAEKPPIQLEPKLFDRLELEIRGFPLADVLNAIEKRSGVPFFYDHNSLARHGVELAETKVTLVRDQVSLMVALGRLLSQSKPALVDEMRVDENGKPFLWISTIRQ